MYDWGATASKIFYITHAKSLLESSSLYVIMRKTMESTPIYSLLEMYLQYIFTAFLFGRFYIYFFILNSINSSSDIFLFVFFFLALAVGIIYALLWIIIHRICLNSVQLNLAVSLRDVSRLRVVRFPLNLQEIDVDDRFENNSASIACVSLLNSI